MRNQIIEQGFKNPILLLHPRDIESQIPLSFRLRQLKFHLDEGHLDPATTILALAPAFDL
jgi:hypothetical protein